MKFRSQKIDVIKLKKTFWSNLKPYNSFISDSDILVLQSLFMMALMMNENLHETPKNFRNFGDHPLHKTWASLPLGTTAEF